MPQMFEIGNLNERCKEVVQFLTKNLDQFVREYNKMYEDMGEELNIEYLENYIPTFILDEQVDGVYVDFNDDNGYMVMSLDYEIFEIVTNGDLEYLKDEQYLFFSSLDGFVYFNGHSYERYAEDMITSSESIYDQTAYAGQSENGDGKIYDIDAYVSARYSSYSHVSSQKKIVDDGFNFIKQSATSYYLKYVSTNGGDTYSQRLSEANCALTAMYAVMNSWQKRNVLSNLPDISNKVDVYETISQDTYYAQYGKDSSSAISEGSTKTYWGINSESCLRNMRKLYVDIRSRAIKNYGYTPESGLSVSNVPSVMKGVANQYGYNISVEKTTSFANVQANLDNGQAVYLSIGGSSTYGNHGVALVGYEKYSYKSGWWIFGSTKYVYFFAINDGHNLSLQYFDPNTSANPTLTYCYY